MSAEDLGAACVANPRERDEYVMTDHVIEAEEMSRENYNIVTGNQASGGELVRISSGTGSLSTTNPGEGGTYSLTIFAQDETDGMGTIDVYVDGSLVGTVKLDTQTNGGGSNNSGFSEFTLEGIEIPEGATIELFSNKDGGEFMRVDKIELTKTDGAATTVTLLHEDFEGSADTVNLGKWDIVNGFASTDGNDDGTIRFDEVSIEGLSNGKISLDLWACGHFEEWGHQYGDMLKIMIVDQNGTHITLDRFSGWGSTLTGNKTGYELNGTLKTFEYDVPEGVTSFELKIRSDISAASELIKLDNVKITAEQPAAAVAQVLPVIDAIDDSITVFESETFGDDETLDSGASSILANDTLDGQPYEGFVVEVNGVEASVGQWIDLDKGRIKINGDGTVDFDADGDFDSLDEGQSEQVSVNYTIKTTAPGGDGTSVEDAFSSFSHGDIVTAGEGFTVRAVRAQDGPNGANAAMVFNSNLSGTADPDLEVNEGNLLIITEDFDGSDPDDNAGGGTFFFDFDDISTLESIRFVDLEGAEAGSIRLYDSEDNLIDTIPAVATGDGGSNVQPINVEGVARMEVELTGSGSIDFIKFTPASDVVIIDEAQVNITVKGEDDFVCEVVAGDDFITVFEDEAFGDIETLDRGGVDIHTNDTENGAAFTGEVSAVNGDAGDVGQIVTGSNGGRAVINADGTVDFDANGEFDFLADGETAETTFTYEIESECTKDITYNVLLVIDVSNSTVGLEGENALAGVSGIGDVNNDGRAGTVLDAQIEAAKVLIEDLRAQGIDPANVNVGISTFSGVDTSGGSSYNDATVDSEVVGTFNLGDPNIDAALEGILSGSWTNYEAGLSEAEGWFADNQDGADKNVMYFLSDGRPITGFENGAYVEQDASEFLDEVGRIESNYNADIYAIGIGQNASLEILDQIDNSGNGAAQVTDVDGLNAAILAPSIIEKVTDTATVTVKVVGKEDEIVCEVVAGDDFITVFEDEAFGDIETLDRGGVDIHTNDTENGAAFTGEVSAVNGDAGDVGQIVTGSNGGRAVINADGTVDFDANGEFDFLADGETAETTFTYEIESECTKDITYNVLLVIDVSNSTVGLEGENALAGVSGIGDVNNDGRAGTVLDAQIEAAKVLIEDLRAQGIDPANVNVGISTFSGVDTSGGSSYNDATVDSEVVGTFNLGDPNIDAALEGILSGSWTNYEAGLSEAEGWFADNQDGADKNVMYFLSDGRPITGFENGAYVEQDASEFLDEVGRIESNYNADIYAIGIGQNASLEILDQIDNSGNGAAQVTDVDGLNAAILAPSIIEKVTDTATVTVKVVGKDDANTLDDGDETATTNENAPVTITNLITNTTDENVATVEVVSVNGVDIPAGQDSVTFTDAKGGVFTVFRNGDASFDPNGGYEDLGENDSATSVLTYEVIDENGLRNDSTITVTITGVNDLSDEGEEVTVTEDSGVTTFDQNPEDNALFNTVDPEAGDPTVTPITDVDGSNGGKFTITSDGVVTFDTDSDFDSLGNGEVAVTEVTYTVTDAAGDSVTSTYKVTVTGVNDLADDGEESTVEEGSGVNALTNVLDNTDDPESEAPGTAAKPTVTPITDVAGSNGGLFTIGADGTASFDTAEDFAYLGNGETAETEVSYTVTDANGDSVDLDLQGHRRPV